MSWDTQHHDVFTYNFKRCKISSDSYKIEIGAVVLIGYGLQVLTLEPRSSLGVVKIEPGCFCNKGELDLVVKVGEFKNFRKDFKLFLCSGTNLTLHFANNQLRSELFGALMKLNPQFVCCVYQSVCETHPSRASLISF
eukprot:m.76040 g.76040  ORF g.76040 m.76040 type:complete len:138 (-) comp11863_c0_seq2:83-496(-)